jgi:hypothetical protein
VERSAIRAQLICDVARRRRVERYSFRSRAKSATDAACDACGSQQTKTNAMQDVFREVLAAVLSLSIASRFVSTLRDGAVLAMRRLIIVGQWAAMVPKVLVAGRMNMRLHPFSERRLNTDACKSQRQASIDLGSSSLSLLAHCFFVLGSSNTLVNDALPNGAASWALLRLRRQRSAPQLCGLKGPEGRAPCDTPIGAGKFLAQRSKTMHRYSATKRVRALVPACATKLPRLWREVPTLSELTFGR